MADRAGLKPFATAGELLKYALVCAIRDRESYADADSGPDGTDAQDEAKAFRAYLKRRFHSRPADDALKGAEYIYLSDLRALEKDKPHD